MNKLLFLCIFQLNMLPFAFGQTDPFSGTFTNASSTIILRFKAVGTEYHGVLQTGAASFAMKSSLEDKDMYGTIYGVNGPVDFSASFQNNILQFNAYGYQEAFMMSSTEHELDDIDVTVFMKDNSQTTENQIENSTQNSETATEAYANNAPSDAHGQNNTTHTFKPLHDDELFALIAGSQVVMYTRTSYVSDHVASSMTYINFCEDGRFWLNTDGSFMVEGSYGGNAQGASQSQNYGKWELIEYQGTPAVNMLYNDGNTSVNPIHKDRLKEGRWRIGNTQYAIQRNKVHCQ